MRWSRRGFLGSLLAVAGLGARSAVAGELPVVVVVGAGPAGLAAAQALTEKGIAVVVLEASSQVGGKARGWTEHVEGVPVEVENGALQLDERCVNVLDLLERTGLSGALVEVPRERIALRTAEGRVALAPGPLRRLARQRLGRRVAKTLRAGAAWLAGATDLRERFGGRPVTDLDAATPLAPFREIVSRLRFWVGPRAVDGATFLFMERSLGERVLVVDGSAQTKVWRPLADRLIAAGVDLRLGRRVAGVRVGPAGVLGVQTGQPSRVFTHPLPERAWRRVAGDVWIRAVSEGVPGAVEAICGHCGTGLEVVATGFRCPRDDVRYDPDGGWTAGPPSGPLTWAGVEVVGGEVRITFPSTAQDWAAAAVIVAVDAVALAEVAGPQLPMAKYLKGTPTTVARFWFDQDVSFSRPFVELVESSRTVTSVRWLHRIQAPSRVYVAEHGGSVLEVTLGRDLPPAMTREGILDLIETDVRLLFPSLQGARARKRSLVVDPTYTWYQPAWENAASPVDTDVAGLFIAGDHVRLGSEGAPLERAVASGRKAAEAVVQHLRSLSP